MSSCTACRENRAAFATFAAQTPGKEVVAADSRRALESEVSASPGVVGMRSQRRDFSRPTLAPLLVGRLRFRPGLDRNQGIAGGAGDRRRHCRPCCGLSSSRPSSSMRSQGRSAGPALSARSTRTDRSPLKIRTPLAWSSSVRRVETRFCAQLLDSLGLLGVGRGSLLSMASGAKRVSFSEIVQAGPDEAEARVARERLPFPPWTEPLASPPGAGAPETATRGRAA